MSSFTKTLIVDCDNGPIYTIKEAVDALGTSGGTVIVESGTYIFNQEDVLPYDNNSTTVHVPGNTTIIGRGNAVIKITRPEISAFKNTGWYNSGSNDHITISGFKIVVACGTSSQYNSHVIFMQNVSDSVIEKITIEAPYDPQNPGDSNPRGVFWGSYAILFYARDFDPDHYYCRHNTVRQCFIRNFGTIDPDDSNPDTKYKYGCGIGFTRHDQTDGFCCDSVVKHNHVSFCHFNMVCTAAERITIKNNVFTRAMGHHKVGDEYKRALNINVGGKYFIIRGNQLNETDATTGAHGLYPSGCEGVIISGNVACYNGGNGIKPRASAVLSDEYYVIIANVCSENGRNGGGNGIHLQAGANWQIIGANNCNKNVSCGIRVQHDDENGPAEHDLVAGNVAVLHAPPYNDDAPISVYDINTNIVAVNLTDKLP